MSTFTRIVMAGATVLALSEMPATSFADTTEIRQCVYDICGGRETLQNYSGQGPLTTLIPLSLRAKLNTELRPALNAMADFDIKRAQMTLAYLDSLTSQTSFSDDDRILLNMGMLYTIDLTQAAKFIMVNQDDVTSINDQALAKVMPLIQPSELKILSGFAGAIFGAEGMKTAQNIFGRPLATALKVLKLEDAKALAEAIQPMVDRISLHLGLYYISPSELAVLRKAKEGRVLNALEERELVYTAARAYTSDEITQGKVRDVYSQNFVGVPRFKEILQARVTEIRSLLKSPARLAATRAKAMQRCERAINGYIASAPSAFKLRRYQALFEDLKGAAIRVLPKYFSAKAIEPMTKEVQAAQVNLPPDRETAVRGLEEMLSQYQSEASLMSAAISVNSDERAKIALQALHEYADSRNELDQVLFQGMKQKCSTLAASDINDMTMSGNIFSSWQSIIYHEPGASVLAHEIGHRVSLAMPEEKADEMKPNHECTFAQHKAIYGENAAPAWQQAEEDWADTFSASVGKELASTWPYAGNVGCPLIHMNENTGEPDPAILDLSTDPNLEHSSEIFRLIRMQIESGKPLPASCANLPELKGKKLKTCAK